MPNKLRHKPRPNNSPKPTAIVLERLLADQRLHWKKAVAAGEKDREMVNNVHDVSLPEFPKSTLIGEPYEFRHGDGADIADSFQGLTNIRTQYSVDDPGLGPKAKRESEDIEKFANKVRWVVEDELGEKVQALVNADMADFGWSGVKVLPYPQRWRQRYPKRNVDAEGEEFEEGDSAYTERVRRFGATAPIPIGIWHIPAPEFWPVLIGDKVVKSLWVTTVKYSYLQATYPKVFSPDESIDKGLEQADFDIVEFIDDTWQVVWVYNSPDGSQKFNREVHAWRHKMPVPEGQAPVVLYKAFNSSDRRPEFRFKGVLRNIYETLKAKDFVMSRQLTMVQIFMWLTVIFKREKNSSWTGNTVEFNFGGANTLPEGIEMSILGPNETLPDAEAAYNRLEERRKRHWPDILQGIVGGESSGYLYQLTRDTALTKLKPVLDNSSDSDVEVMRMVFYAIGGVTQILRPRGNDITVFVRFTEKKGTVSVSASWDKVADLINLVRATRNSDLPQDQHSKLDAVEKAIASGMSRRRAWQEIFGLEDPEFMDDEKIAEEILDSDIIRARRIQDVLIEMDLEFERQEGETPDETALATADGPFPPAFAAAFGVPPGAAELVAGSDVDTGSVRALTSPRAGTRTAPDTESRPPGPGGVSGTVA